jgi:hypothetical protein
VSRIARTADSDTNDHEPEVARRKRARRHRAGLNAEVIAAIDSPRELNGYWNRKKRPRARANVPVGPVLRGSRTKPSNPS